MIDTFLTWNLATMHSVLLIVLFGILSIKYFGRDLKKKDGVGVLFAVFVFWGIFFFSGLYGMLVSPTSVSVFLSSAAFVVVLVLFSYMCIRYYEFVDLWMIAVESFFFLILIGLIFADKYCYSEALSQVILIVVSIVTWGGYFMTIRFLLGREVAQ